MSRLFSVLYVLLEGMNVPNAKKKGNIIKWITQDLFWFLSYNFMFWLKQNSILKILLTMASVQVLCQLIQILFQGKYCLITHNSLWSWEYFEYLIFHRKYKYPFKVHTVADYRPSTVRLQVKTLLSCILLLTPEIEVNLLLRLQEILL